MNFVTLTAALVIAAVSQAYHWKRGNFGERSGILVFIALQGVIAALVPLTHSGMAVLLIIAINAASAFSRIAGKLMHRHRIRRTVNRWMTESARQDTR